MMLNESTSQTLNETKFLTEVKQHTPDSNQGTDKGY